MVKRTTTPVTSTPITITDGMSLAPATQLFAADSEEEQILLCFRAMTKESQSRCLERMELSAVLYPRIRQPIISVIRGGRG